MHKGFGNQGHQAGMGHDSHNTGVEGELEDDAPSLAGLFLKGGGVVQGVPPNGQADAEDNQVKDVQVHVKAVFHKVIHGEGQPQQGDKPGPKAHVLHLFRKGVPAANRPPRFLAVLLFLHLGGVQHDELAPVLGAHKDEAEGHQHQHPRKAKEIEAAENHLPQGDHPHIRFEGVAGGGNPQGHRPSEAHFVGDDAGIAPGGQQGQVVGRPFPGELHRRFLRQKGPGDEADAPVDKPQHQGGYRKHQHRPRRAFGDAAQAGHPPFHRWGLGQAGPGNEAEGHLHGKGDKLPEALGPVFHHLDGGGGGKGQGQKADNEG